MKVLYESSYAEVKHRFWLHRKLSLGLTLPITFSFIDSLERLLSKIQAIYCTLQKHPFADVPQIWRFQVLQNSQENTCAKVSFLIKLQADWRLSTSLKRDSSTGIFLWILWKFLRTPFLQNTSGRLLLALVYCLVFMSLSSVFRIAVLSFNLSLNLLAGKLWIWIYIDYHLVIQTKWLTKRTNHPISFSKHFFINVFIFLGLLRRNLVCLIDRT